MDLDTLAKQFGGTAATTTKPSTDLDNLAAQFGGKASESAPAPAATVAEPPAMKSPLLSKGLGIGFGYGVGPVNMGGVKDIVDAAKGGWNQMKEAINESKAGKNPLETGLKFGAGAIGAVTSPLAPVFAPVNKAIDFVGDKIGDIPAVQKFADSKAGEITARVAEDVGNASIIAGTAAGMAKSNFKGVKQTFKDTRSAIESIKNSREKTQISKAAAKDADTIKSIQTNYSKLRKNMNAAPDDGAPSRNRVANAGILSDAVDKDGTIRTMQKGGAYEQYKTHTLDGAEGVVRNDLAREGAKANIRDVESGLRSNINRSNLTIDKKAAAQTKIDSIVSEWKRLYPDGKIPLEVLQDEKIRTTQNIDYTNSSSKIEQKAVGNAYKVAIERNSNLPIRQINQALAEYLKDLDLIESLDGRKVRGGRLGKYFSTVSGNIVGGVAGNAVGGPFGSALGTIVGGELGARIQSQIFRNMFVKFGGDVLQADIIKEAISRSKSPRPALPAPAAGSPRSSIGSGNPVILPSKMPIDQSIIDADYSKSFGNRNAKYNNTNIPKANAMSESIPLFGEKVKDNSSMTFYRGQPVGEGVVKRGGGSMYGNGAHFNESPTVAKMYGDNIIEFSFKPESNVIKFKGNKELYDSVNTWAEQTKGKEYRYNTETNQIITEWAKENGVDGIIVGSDGVIFNNNSVIRK